MHPADLVFFWGRSNPEHPALIQPDMVLTYRELAEAIETISARISHYAFSRDEPVAVSIHQPIQMLAVCLALLRNGISVAPVDRSALPHLRANGIYNLIFTGEGLVLSGGRNIRFEDSWLRRDSKSSTHKFSANESSAGTATVIFLTPTNEGGLKKMILPSRALMARMKLLPLIGEANYDRVLIVPSVNSPSGFCRAAVSLYAGRTACFAATNAARLLVINTFNVDALVCTPQEAADLAEFVGKSNTERLDPLREVWIEDGYLSLDLGRRIQTHLCHNVLAGYESAEAGRIALASLDALSGVPDAVGFVAPHATVEIVDDNDKPVTPGELGRLRCRTEYYLEVAAANKLDHAGEPWWYPRRFGRLGSDGLLCIVEADSEL